MLYSIDKNATELIRLIDRTLGRPYNSDPGTAFTGLSEGVDKSKSAPGSVNGVEYILGRILGQVVPDSVDPADSAAFDMHLTDIQNINAQISTLSSALSSRAFASNTIALLNNYSALTGILDLAKIGSDQNNCQTRLPSLQPAGLENMSPDDLEKLPSRISPAGLPGKRLR